MTQPTVLHTQGTKFQRGALVSAVLTWTTVALMKDIKPADKSRTTIDVTTIDQYDGADPDKFKYFAGGLIESGAVDLDMIFDPTSTNQRTLEDDIEADDPIDYRILYIDGSYRQFKGIVTSVAPSGSMDDVNRQTVSIKVSGRFDYTPAV